MTEFGTIDTETGAPAVVRAVVGGLSKPKDRLATLRKFYPTAIPDPEDGQNFLFLNPKTGRFTSYNPKGLDAGDVASITREGTQVVGATAGATVGVPGGLPGIAAGSVLGGMAGEELFQLVLKGIGAQDTRTLEEHAGETAFIGATSLGGPAGAGLQKGASAGTKAAFRGASGEGVQELIDDAARFGFTPSVGPATRNKTIDMLETFVSRTPGGFGVMKNAVDDTLTKVHSSVEEIAKNLAGRTPEKAVTGRVVQKGIEDVGGFVERFNVRGGQLFDSIPIDDVYPVSMNNTLSKLREMTEAIPGAAETSEILKNKQLSKILSALEADISDYGTLPYEAIKKLRTLVGKKAASTSLIDEVPRAEWKNLYGAISDDIKTAATEAGPKAKQAFDRANKFWKAGNKRIDDVLEPLVKNKVPEKVFTAIERAGKEGPTRIRAIRRSLKPHEWRVVAGQVLSDMGLPTPGKQVEEAAGFSFDSWLTRWNTMDDAAKAAMFGNMGDLKDSLNSLSRLARSVRESGQAFANPSGTAGASVGQLMMFGSIGSVGSGLVTGSVEGALLFPAITAFGALGVNRVARLFTSPSFVKWLAATAKIKPNGVGAHIGRLAQVAASGDLDLKQAVLDYSQEMFGGLGSPQEAPQDIQVGP